MKRERDEPGTKCAEDIMELVTGGKLEALKQYDVTEIMALIDDAFTQACEHNQLAVVKYLWELCQQEKGEQEAQNLWGKYFDNNGFNFTEICEPAFEQGQWDLSIWYFKTLFRKEGGVEMDDYIPFECLEELIRLAFQRKTSLEFYAAFWEELSNRDVYGGAHFASACLNGICSTNDLDLLKKFVQKCHINLSEWVNLEGYEVEPLLFSAFRANCSIEFAEYLLDNGANLYEIFSHESLLHRACKTNSLALVEFLFVKRGIEITSEWLNFKSNDGRRDHAFSEACAYSSLDIVEFLFQKRGLFSPNSEVLIQAFFAACGRSSLDVVKFLYQNRSQFLRKSQTITSLMGALYEIKGSVFRVAAALNPNVAVLKYLLEQEYANYDLAVLEDLKIFLQLKPSLGNENEVMSLVVFFKELKQLDQGNSNKAQTISILKSMNKDILDQCMETELLRPCEGGYQLTAKQGQLIKCLLVDKLSGDAPFKGHWSFITHTFIQLANNLKGKPASQRLALYHAAIFADALLKLNEDDQEVGARLSTILCAIQDLKQPEAQIELIEDQYSFLKKYPVDLWAIIKDISNQCSEPEFCLTSKFLTIECADHLIKGSSEKTPLIKRSGPGIFEYQSAPKKGRHSEDEEQQSPHPK